MDNKDKAGVITILDFNLYHKDTGIKPEWYQKKIINTFVDQQNRIEDVKTTSGMLSCLTSDKGAFSKGKIVPLPSDAGNVAFHMLQIESCLISPITY